MLTWWPACHLDSIEAAELLEHFQWRDAPTQAHSEIGGEPYDVMIYRLQLAMSLDIDVTSAIIAKLAEAASKYPAELFSDGDDGGRKYHAARDATRRAADRK